jgi:hypothetical protein
LTRHPEEQSTGDSKEFRANNAKGDVVFPTQFLRELQFPDMTLSVIDEDGVHLLPLEEFVDEDR